MIILLIVKPKRHGSGSQVKEPSPGPVEDGPIARPLQEDDPGGTLFDGLGSKEDGAPSQFL